MLKVSYMPQKYQINQYTPKKERRISQLDSEKITPQVFVFLYFCTAIARKRSTTHLTEEKMKIVSFSLLFLFFPFKNRTPPP